MNNLCNCAERSKLYKLNKELDDMEEGIMDLMRGDDIESYQDAASLILDRESIKCQLHDLHNKIYKNEL